MEGEKNEKKRRIQSERLILGTEGGGRDHGEEKHKRFVIEMKRKFRRTRDTVRKENIRKSFSSS